MSIRTVAYKGGKVKPDSDVNIRRGVPQQKKLYNAGLSRESEAEEGAKSSWHKTVKREGIRPLTPLSLADARRIVADFAHEYNILRLHSGIGYVTQARLKGRDKQIVAERSRKRRGTPSQGDGALPVLPVAARVYRRASTRRRFQ